MTIGRFGVRDKEVDRRDELQAVVRSKKPVLLDHWRDLLKPLTDQGFEVSPTGDYRMAVMAFLGTPEPENLTDDEWFALAEADGAGFKTYASSFRESRLQDSTYDRWWTNDAQGEWRDRWVAGPLTLARVMAIGSPNPPPWVDRVRASWWRQYLLIFLLAHFQRAGLLTLESKFTEATRFLPMSKTYRGLWRLRKELEQIEGDMALFLSRFWFTEVSPQAQGQDLFALLRRQIGSEALYRSAIADKSFLTEWVRTRYWDIINDRVIPIGLYFTIISVLAGPVAKLMGLLTFCSFPCTGTVYTPEFRESATFLTIVFGGILIIYFVSWRLFGRAKS